MAKYVTFQTLDGEVGLSKKMLSIVKDDLTCVYIASKK